MAPGPDNRPGDVIANRAEGTTALRWCDIDGGGCSSDECGLSPQLWATPSEWRECDRPGCRGRTFAL